MHKPTFHPVVKLPASYEVLDFSDPTRLPRPEGPYTIGRYGEKRPGLYAQALFAGERIYHVGIDIGAPAGTAIHAFAACRLYAFADHTQAGDYGPTLITEQEIEGEMIYALFGHLSRASLAHKKVGQTFAPGAVLGFMGSEEENGGWPPHLHFQLSRVAPLDADLPGVVSAEDLSEALRSYPDPRLVLGALY